MTFVRANQAHLRSKIMHRLERTHIESRQEEALCKPLCRRRMLERKLAVVGLINLDDENQDSLKPAIRVVLADIFVRDVVKVLQ